VFGSLTVAHGHNYALEVTIRGENRPAPRHGDGSGRAQARGGRSGGLAFRPRDLNQDPLFPPGTIPTTENLVRAIWDLLGPKLGAERLHRLRLWEDPTFYVEYLGG